MRRETIWLLARIAFWIALIFAYVMAIIPGGEPGLELPNDKLNHILAFTTLAFLARIGWIRSSAWIIAVLLIAFGGFIELSQAMPLIHRDAEWGDLLADAVAVIVGLVVTTLLMKLAGIRLPAAGAKRTGD